MATFDEKTTEKLHSRPLSRTEAEQVYEMRKRFVVLSDLALVALIAVCALAGFVPWHVAAIVAALTVCLLPLSLRVFRRELEEQVHAGLSKSPSEPRG